MVVYSIGWLVVVVGAVFASRLRGVERTVALFGFPFVGLLLLCMGRQMGPGYRLLASSLFMLYALKGASSTLDAKTPRGWLQLVAMLVWPGFDHENFTKRAEPPALTGKRFRCGLLWCYVGGAGILAVALAEPKLGVAGPWIGIVALLAFVHFGISNILTSLIWLSGYPVKPLFDEPFRSRSLRDFWTARWNLPFVEMDRRLFLQPLIRAFGLRGAVFGIFVVSGLLHEMALSYPAGGGWGGPLLYFVLQGLLVLAEKRWRLGGRIWTMFWVVAPLPILFHAPFRQNLIQPFFEWLNRELTGLSIEWWFSRGLWVLGALQLCVLMASFQVPTRLRWKEELPRLSPFNQKLMWTYGATIVFVVIGFGLATFMLHDQMLRGDSAALAIAGFIAAFWTMRLLFDAFYFRSEDWPKGAQFEIGHLLLNSLFVALVLGYGGLVVWRLFV